MAESAPETPTPKPTTAICDGAQPPILRVEGDTVIVINAQGVPEKVPMQVFGSQQWEPGNPGNPAVSKANKCYSETRIQILSQAGQRPAATVKSCNDDQKRILTNCLQLAKKSLVKKKIGSEK